MTTPRRRLAVRLALCLVLGAGLLCSGNAPTAAQKASQNRDLAADERLGGHTLQRHVGRSDDDLRDRLEQQPGISAASTYTDRATAERVVGDTLARERARVERWLNRTGSRPNLTLDYHGPASAPIGRTVRRGDSRVLPCTDAIVVLRWDARRGYYVLTSYPERRR
jgi:toxin YxiD